MPTPVKSLTDQCQMIQPEFQDRQQELYEYDCTDK